VSRWLEREEEKPSGGLDTGLSRGGSGEQGRERAIPAAASAPDFGDNRRERAVVNGREYWVRRSECELLFETGKFRSADFEDLVTGIYAGDRNLAEADFKSLSKQGLARAMWIKAEDSSPRRIISLMRDGGLLLNKIDPRIDREDQVVYAGQPRVSQLEHDSLLYRAYLRERSRLHSEGASVRRVVLDDQLKKELFSKQHKMRGESYNRIQERSAAELSLPLIDGRVMLPDFRLEYEEADGERSRVDVEVATGNYRQAQLAAKIQAGFRVYCCGLGVQSGGYLKGNYFKGRPSAVFSL